MRISHLITATIKEITRIYLHITHMQTNDGKYTRQNDIKSI